MKIPAKFLLAAAALLCASGASFAQTLVSESFNYGAVTSSIAGQSGGTNWSSNWAVNGTANGQYQTTNLTISTSGYWNPSAADSGSLGLTNINNTGTFATHNEVRQFAPGSDTTMWMSYLFNLGDYNANTQAYLLMNTNVGNSIRIAGTGSGSIRVSGFYNNSGTTAKDLTSSAGNTYLILAKFTLATGNDSFQLWVNPSNLTGGEAGLGTADYTSGSTLSLFGSGAQAMNWGFRSSTGADAFVDNWRISYGGSSLAGLTQVLTDPSTWSTWSGAGANANWDTAENWTGNFAPTNGSDVTFLSGNGSGSTISLNGSRTNGTVTFNNTDATPAATTFNGGVASVWTVNNGILMTNSSADFTVSDSNLSIQMDSDGMFLTNTTSKNLTVSTAIAGVASAVLTKGGSGTVTLSGANTYSSGTLISEGTLQIGNGGTTGSIGSTSGVTNNGTLAFNRSDNLTVSNAISGSGNVTKSGAGTLVLSGANTYSGGTLLSGGTLRGDTTSLQGAITNNAAAIFDTATNGTYAGVMSGGGTVTKTGAGTLTLTATNSYSGSTTVETGKLVVNGAISNSAVTVQDSAVLGGSGWVGSTIVNSNATIAPGNSPGTLNINGDLTWNNAGNYDWEVFKLPTAGVAGTDWDLLSVTGKLDLTNLTGAPVFNINLYSLSATNSAGALANWSTTGTYAWKILASGSAIANFSTNYFGINTTQFAAYNDISGGIFALELRNGSQDLYLTYSGGAPIPEPGTWAAAALLAGAATFVGWRRRRRV